MAKMELGIKEAMDARNFTEEDCYRREQRVGERAPPMK
jgi:hypothetical protein